MFHSPETKGKIRDYCLNLKKIQIQRSEEKNNFLKLQIETIPKSNAEGGMGVEVYQSSLLVYVCAVTTFWSTIL